MAWTSTAPARVFDRRGLYVPINTLKAVDEDIWIVDGPQIAFGPGCCKAPFTTRMTVIRVGERDLFLHSPTQLTPDLRSQVQRIGTPRWIIGPNRLHGRWICEWSAAFPDAEVFLAPKIAEQVGRAKAEADRSLAATPHLPWASAIDSLPIRSHFMTEIVFFHRPSRSLVLTDLIENFEAEMLPSPLFRLAAWLGGALAPNGQMPRDMRMSFLGRRRHLRAAILQLLAWEPKRVLLAHGRWIRHDGASELRRAFRWLLG